ncbi:MAG TPA: ABC transporter substrate-binding protein [Oligoflexia bacterium]|nr:ABC transporter substrate-binding protein [Oligoflexia bacterium]HMP49246.1 ABC transporter substrate-binding protein [Oligoflexia bacterium]
MKRNTKNKKAFQKILSTFITLIAAVVLPIFTLSVQAESAGAGKTVETTVNQVKSTVTELSGKLGPKELDEKLKTIITPVFDFEEMSRRCLGVNWNNATKEEQKEFTSLFAELLARSYLKQIRDNAKDSEFTLASAREEGRRAIVQTLVKTPKETIKLDYRLYQKGGNWKVYDVIIENIGLVSNYRSEFGGIITKEGIKGLIQQLRTKVEG